MSTLNDFVKMAEEIRELQQLNELLVTSLTTTRYWSVIKTIARESRMNYTFIDNALHTRGYKTKLQNDCNPTKVSYYVNISDDGRITTLEGKDIDIYDELLQILSK